MEVRLTDAAGQPVLAGEVGEILVRAPNVMREYWRAPDHASFEGGWFHSGDLARMRDDGCFEVVGRSKDMIISGGENIYPAEIENALVDCPGVLEAAVVGVPDERWGEVPVAVVVCASSASATQQSVLDFLGARIARFKLPRRVVIVDALPKSALGKVQKPILIGWLSATSESRTSMTGRS
ncbi:AMP-binding protein [Pandoraea sp. XY-2]|uniref:AMP-binding enzyme n=1 Tax=Pandoraea sp. XY-2 TaxID=2518599 RepID=UPI0013EEE298|nr:AMP-binding protein [Pandoraea sp. XY-2]